MTYRRSQTLPTSRLRIGCLAGWQVYDGATLETYLNFLLNGLVAASHDLRCDLLLACGVGPPTRPYIFSPAWPEPAPHATFVPVGPWNCDGLIVVPPIYLLPAGDDYVRRLIDTGFPVVCAGANELGPTVAIDNAAGIAAAVEHLVAHGHRTIALIAGHKEIAGDSAERLQAFSAAMAAAGLPVDPRLVVAGNHSVEQGEEAMTVLLEQGLPFTAVITSNDNSAFGALRALRRAGLRVPDDVALIGFDNLVESRAQTPPLTTVHQSPFDLGYQALVSLLDLRAGRWDGRARRNIPVRLITRQSCGCRPGLGPGAAGAATRPADTLVRMAAQAMADALRGEARQLYARELTAHCGALAGAFLAALDDDSPVSFQQALVQALRESEALGEDVHIWHSAILALQQLLELMGAGPERLLAAERLVSWAHLTVSERTRRQVTRVVLQQVDLADRVGTMTAQLLASLDEAQIAATLTEHLGQLGIAHLLVVLYEAEGDTPQAWCRIALAIGLPARGQGQRFPTGAFPPLALYPAGTPVQLAVLPLVSEDETIGFAAFEAGNLEPCATIARNLASALRTSRLYREAAEGRRLAEEASQLKTRFLSMVSHELRTPLNVIIGLSEMLVRDTAHVPAETPLHADLERVYASAQHLGQLIGDVLDLASSDAGQLRLTREPLDLSEVLQMVAAAGEQMARARGLAWQATLPHPGPLVLGDRTRLRQIVLNLVSNAVKFTEQGAITLTLVQGQGRAVITVRDTGMGVAPGEQEQIFDVFRRADASLERGYGGLGLGLAICRQLVELHDGQISMHSSGQPGEGATFSVALPTLESMAALAPRDLPQDVLVLAHAGEPLAASLRAQGYRVRLLADLAEIDSALATPPGAILLDSPGAARYGAALARLLQADPRLAHVPLLVWGAAATAGAVVELNLLAKPMSPGRLARAILREDLGPGADRTVLVVDDTAALRALHRRIVGEALPEARVIEARDGREALALMERQVPDLVLLDLMMPELDGFGVLEAMRSDPRTRSVPVLVLTARPLDDADMARLQHGVSAILAKGLFSVEETVGHITSALQRQRRLSGQTRRLMHRALVFIHERYAEPINRELIAAHVGVNENYLSECFHAEMGVTPMAYLTRYRISRACVLLEEGAASITAVAAAVGFADSAYFSRVFQRVMGMSPRAYRRRPRET
jgi:signal transduction histidine kinase/AraC-like DNA-binding protein/ActR/RegA family two-component response regulator